MGNIPWKPEEMKMKKRVLIMLLALCLLAGLVPTAALATPAEEPAADGEIAVVDAAETVPEGYTLEDDAPAILAAGDVNISPRIQLRSWECYYHHGPDTGTVGPANNDAGNGWDGPGQGSYDTDRGGVIEAGGSGTSAYIHLKERDHFKNADYLLLPFGLRVNVPAYTTYQVDFKTDISMDRNANGATWYFMELMDDRFDATHTGAGFHETFSTKADTADLGQVKNFFRIYSKNRSHSASVNNSFTFANDTAAAKDVELPLVLLVGNSKSTSLLNSYHHQLESTLTFNVQKVAAYKTVTFNPNGGILSNGSNSSKTVTSGGVYGTLPTPITRTGYSFDGWYTAESGGSKVESDTKVIENVPTLYAHWTQNSYTLTFNANYTGGTVTPATMTVKHGEPVTQLPTPTRTGYTFRNWCTAPTGGSPLTNGTRIIKNYTLYAYWTADNRSVTVTFDAAGGSVSSADKTVTAGGGYGALPTPTKTGYTFDGWFTERVGGTQVTKADTVDIAAVDHTLYAHWTAKNNINVTLEANRGSFDGEATKTVTVTYNSTYGELPTPTRNNYAFQGWYTALSGGSQVESGTTVTKAGSHTLYARWKQNTVTVSFNANGGTPATQTRNVTIGAAVGALPIPTRTGYTFDGWFTEQTGGDKVTAAQTASTAVTYYAHWTKNQYTVTFDVNGGAGANITRKVDFFVGELPAEPTWTGHTFGGWFTAADGGKQVNAETRVTDNVTYYAHWTVKQYTVTFNTGGGPTVQSRTVDHGATLGELPAGPAWEGYTFGGWFTAPIDGTKIETPQKVTANVTYYAQWTAQTMNVTFVPGEGGSVSETSKSVTYGQPYGDLPVPTHNDSDQKFVGWQDTNGNTVTASTVVVTAGNHELTAQWKNTHTHKVDPNGSGNAAEFTVALTASTDLNNGGDFYLSNDLTINDTLTIPANQTVNLCLNGHNISTQGGNTCITVASGGTLNLCDCAGTGAVTGGGGGGNSIKNTGGTVNIYSGNVNVTSGNGSGIDNTGTVTVSGGSINVKVNNSTGSGIKNSGSGTVTVTGGSVTNSSTTGMNGSGSGIYNEGTVTVTGGTVTSGIYGIYHKGGAFTLGGSPVISGGTGKAGIFLTEGKTVAVDGTKPLTGVYSVATVSGVTYPVNVTTAASADYSGHFVAGNSIAVRNSGTGSDQVVQLCGHNIHRVCGETSCSHADHFYKQTYKPLSQSNFGQFTATGTYSLNAGSYYLTEDITTAKQIQANGKVDLCFNGHTITYTGQSSTGSNACVYVGRSATLNICDCQGTGSIESSRCIYIDSNANGNLYGGTLNGNGTTVTTLGNLTVDGANVISTGAGAADYAIMVQSGTTSIVGGSVESNGGSALYFDYGSGTISGGTITSANGYGVHLTNGTVTLGGSPVIQGETADLYLNTKKTVTVQAPLNGTYSVATTEKNALPYTFVPDGAEYLNNFTAAVDGVAVRVQDGGLQLYKAPTPHIHDDGTAFDTPLTQVSTLSTGSYLLNSNVTLTGTLTVPAGATVDLCLNGKTLTGQLIVNGVLNLYDCKGTGKVMSASITDTGTLNWYGGTLEALEGSREGFLYIGKALTQPDVPYSVSFGADTATKINVNKQLTLTTGWAIMDSDVKPTDCFTPPSDKHAKIDIDDGEVVLRLYQVTVDGTVYYPDYSTGKLTEGELAAPEPRPGYVWQGWFNAETDGTKIDTNTVFADDATLYPRWAVCDHSGNTNTKTTVAATCTTPGSEKYTCSACGLEVETTISILNHSFATTWSYDGDTETHYHKCVNCDARQVDEASHTWGNGAQTTDPTATSTGVMTYTCTETGCGATRTETIPKLPTYAVTYMVDDYTVGAVPTQAAVTEGASITLPNSGLARTGYTLAGWALLDEKEVPETETVDGKTQEKLCTGTFTTLGRDMTFQVRWMRVPNYQLKSGETIVLEDGVKIKKESDTVTIDQNGNSAAETTITLPAGTAAVTIQQGDDENKDKLVLPAGATVKTGSGPVITIGSGGGKVDTAGNVEGSAGSSVTKDGSTVTIAEGSGTINPDGNVTFPENTDGKVAVTDQKNNTTEVTVPGGGEGLDMTPGGQPLVNNPDGSLTIPDGEGGSITVTVPEGDGEDNSAKVDDKGSITVPGSSVITTTTPDGGKTIVTIPDGDDTGTVESDGSVTAPSGSTVETEDPEGNKSDPVTVPEGGGTVLPGGSVAQPKPSRELFTVTDIDPEHATGSITVKGDADKMEWRKVTDPETEWTDVVSDGSTTVTLDELDEGSYEFRYKAEGSLDASLPQEIRVNNNPKGGKALNIDPNITNGTVSAVRTRVKPGLEVRLTVKPSEGYRLATITANYGEGQTITPTWNSNTRTYNFTMPDADVTVTALFASTAPSHTHDWAAAWTTSESHHWHECTADGCDVAANADKNGYAAHVYTNDQDKTCNTCGYVRTISSSGTVVTPENPVELPGGGSVTKNPDTGDVTISPPEGEGGTTTTITPPESGGDVTVDPTTGEVTVPGGSTVKPGENGPEITVPEEGGKVDPSGNITVPGGSTVTIPDGEGGKTEVTVPEGEDATIKPTGDGKVEVPKGSTVKKPNGTTVTVPEGGGTIDPTTGEMTPVKPDEPTPPKPSRPSGGSSTSNKPSVSTSGKGGKVEADSKGNVTITPDKGYQIDKVTVNGKEVTVPADGKLTGLKRTDKVVVTFKEIPNLAVDQFTDVKAKDWFYDSVKAIVEQGLMNGTGETTFSPNLTTSRAMIATILWRLDGSPESKAPLTYPDCKADSWYAKAVAWASEHGVVRGYDNGDFGPDDPITREQLAVMFWRYAQAKGRDVSVGEDTNILSYADIDRAGEWAIPALQWAVDSGVMQGKGGGVLDPQGQATRAEAATMLVRYLKNEK